MRVYGEKTRRKREKPLKVQREKAALISYLGKEMSGVNGDQLRTEGAKYPPP